MCDVWNGPCDKDELSTLVVVGVDKIGHILEHSSWACLSHLCCFGHGPLHSACDSNIHCNTRHNVIGVSNGSNQQSASPTLHSECNYYEVE